MIALFVVVGTVVAVAFDGKVLYNLTFSFYFIETSFYLMQVFLFEACLFPLIYIMYIGCVVALSYIRVSMYYQY